MHRKLPRKTLLALAAAFAVMPAFGDDSATLAELAAQLKASLATIQALQQRVEQLESKQAAAAPAASAGDWGSRIDAVEHNVAQIEASTAAAQQVDTGLALHGFADVKVGAENKANSPNANQANLFRDYNGAQMGTLDLYFTPQISPRIQTLFELAFDYDDIAQQLGVDVERGQIGYQFSDAATLWAGRFHTPYGYWSTAFHHGAQLQTALTRPIFLDWEDSGGVIPAHSVGLWLNGKQRTVIGKVGYDIYTSNGDTFDNGELFFSPRGDATGKVGAGLRVTLEPEGSNLLLGASALTEGVSGSNIAGTASDRIGFNMAGAFAVYDNDDWEAMAEYYSFRNQDLGGGTGTHSSSAWYAQVGYNINDQFTPYARYEDADLNPNDPYFTYQIAGVAYKRTSVGVRYNLTPKAALKLEVAHGTQAGNGGDPSSVAVQYSTRF